MKKITRKDFQRLRQHYLVLTQDEMRRYVDGYSDSSCNGDWFASELYLSDFGVSVFSSGGYGGYDDSYEFPIIPVSVTFKYSEFKSNK